MKKLKKGKTFLTLLAMASAVTAITLGFSNMMTHHLEQELAKKANVNLEKLAQPIPQKIPESPRGISLLFSGVSSGC